MKVEIIKSGDGKVHEVARLVIENSVYEFEEKRELKVAGCYNKSVKVFYSKDVDELTEVSYEVIKKLVKKFQISAVLNCEESIFKQLVKNTNQNIKSKISEERRLLLYTYFEDKLLIYYDK